MFLTFPTFNLYSTTLLIIVAQGFIFAFLLLGRYYSQRHLSDLFLALLLIITGYHRTTYIVGFMDWYDTFRNTKINYWLIHFILAIGPLIYFYIKSLTQPFFKFRKIDFLHFVPALLYFIYRVFVFAYDARQPGFENVQNGWFEENINSVYLAPFIGILADLSVLIYLGFAVFLFQKYRKWIFEYFSNTYHLELNWLRNFLILFISLFVFEVIITITDYSIFGNFWQQRWWGHLANALTMLYVGMMSYFSDLSKLHYLNPKETTREFYALKVEYQELKNKATHYMTKHQPYLNPEITLPELAKAMNLSTNQLSQIINSGFGKNFNEFINEYRVELVKEKLKDPSLEHLSLLGIAMECGFNSKATFNRVFKKFTNQSPTEFLKK